MKQSLAYIDDNESNLDCLGLIFESDFHVKTFQNPLTFLELYKSSAFSAVLVDIHMPLMNGFDLYEKLIEKEQYDGCPIFFISSDDSVATRIKSFSLGAVDFLDRKMTPSEMLTRIKSKIKFHNNHRSIIEFGNLKLNLTLLKASLGAVELKLTFIEFKLLCHLVRSYPEATNKDDLVDIVWTSQHVLDATIYTHTFNLNAKMKNWDFEVVMERKKGMVLVMKSSTL
jgi:DNA-binding response OmpR family regulator